jgi:outer membrane usher protein
MGSAWAQPGTTVQAQNRRVRIDPPTAPESVQAGARINPTGRAINLTIPAKDGNIYLGDVLLTINADDSIEFSSQRVLDLLSNVLESNALKALQGSFASKETLSPADFAASGVGISYNPQLLELRFDIASERRASRSVQVTPFDREKIGNFTKPADFAAYVNIRGSADYLHSGPGDGFQDPVFFLDGAMNIGGVVAESEAFWQPGTFGPDFQRQGSRLVYDDQKRLIRWTAGDLQPIARGFQSAPDIAGLSLFRSYSVLNPQQITRPRGDRSFRLDRPSTVEVSVNGQIVRRLQLNPGNYDLRDFPFAQGSNDIKLSILDDSGRTELLRFNVFLEQSQLAKGLTEFGVYAGVLAPLARRGPHYTNDFAFSGFVRHGFSDRATIGANFQADKTVKMGGVEAVFGTPVGTFSTNVSLSDIKGYGSGWASVTTFQRLIQRGNGRSDTLNLSVETRSKKFGPIGSFLPNNPFKWEVGGGYSHAFNDASYGGFDARYSKGRGLQRDVQMYRLTTGYRLSSTATLTADGRYERDNLGSRVSGLVSLNIRLGRFSSIRSDYDTRDNRARLSYQTLHGQGVGSYSITGDIERSDRGAGASFNGNYIANRAELGVSHFGTFSDNFGRSIAQRTAFRAATSIAIADGAVSVGRPIYDSFAIIKGHKSLKGANVVVEPSPFGITAQTGALNAATQPNLSSYSERTIAIDAPQAKSGVDLGQGSFRVFPGYRSGYVLTVGSDYSVTALGRLLNQDGEAVSLVTGTAVELAHPDRPAVSVFTNREGKFGLTGLAPGKWRIQMNDDQKSVFEITIPDNAEGAVRLGDIAAIRGN